MNLEKIELSFHKLILADVELPRSMRLLISITRQQGGLSEPGEDNDNGEGNGDI